MAVLKVYNGSTWDTIIGKTYNGSTWEDKMRFYDGTRFEELYPVVPPEVTVAATKAIFSGPNLFPSVSNAICKVDEDGDLYSKITGGSFIAYETWLDVGTNNQVWVERTIISGTLTIDPGAGRLACTAERIYTVLQVGEGQKVCVIDLKWYDAVSGGSLLDTQRVTLTGDVFVI